MTPKLKTGLLFLGLGGALIGIFLMAMYSIGIAKRAAEFEARETSSIGTVMPEFSMPVLQQPGKTTPRTVSKRDLLGEPYLLHGWASWCASCREEHADIVAFAKKQRIRFIGYNVDDEPELAVRWLERYGDPYLYSLVQETQQTPGTIPLTTTPQLILVDRNGVVQWRQLGTSNIVFLDKYLQPVLDSIERGQ
jgi:cytochrome c biogenesis protein CcmG, thiol:disulfide interchange protein DsbE